MRSSWSTQASLGLTPIHGRRGGSWPLLVCLPEAVLELMFVLMSDLWYTCIALVMHLLHAGTSSQQTARSSNPTLAAEPALMSAAVAAPLLTLQGGESLTKAELEGSPQNLVCLGTTRSCRCVSCLQVPCISY